MDEPMENKFTEIRCEDELMLQRLLDEELDADASELVFHHLKGCHRCAAVFQELKELKALCEGQLGLEDEIEAPFSSAALARVRTAIATAATGEPVASRRVVVGNGKGQTAPQLKPQSTPLTTIKKNNRAKTVRDWWRSIDPAVLIQPRFVTAAAAIVIIVGVVWWLRAPTTVTATELLAKSAAADDAIASHADQVLRRTINLQTRVGQTVNLSGNTALRRRIEIWQNADKGLAARRLFDEKDRLLAGEWKKSDGSRLIYQEGMQPQLQPVSDRQPNALLSPGSIWLLNVSAKDFSALVGNPNAARVQQTASTYVINYDAPTQTGNGLVKATLVLSKGDLHTIEQTLVVNSSTDRAQFVEYKFSETSFERRTPNTVAPAVFEPDPAVLAMTKGKGATPMVPAETNALTTTPDALTPTPAAATAELEVEVLEKLNRVNALQGEQLSLTRSDGKLLVAGIVETNERKAEILRALSDVAKNPAVRIDVNTVAEAQRRQKSRTNANITIENIEVAENALPVDSELRSYFTRKGLSADQLESQIEQFSRSVLGHSSRARSHALALKQIAERFSPADIEAMDDAARSRWRGLIKEHANSFRRELEEVRQGLAPMFPAAKAGGPSDIDIASDQDIAHAAKRLFELAALTDNGLRRSLSLSSEREDVPVRSTQFWQTFVSAQSLAAKIASRQ